jgi:phage gp45-like
MTIQVGNVTTTPASVYTSVGNTAITFLSLCNYTAGNITANVYVVPSGGTAGNSNIIVTGLELRASGLLTGDTYQLYAGAEKLLLANGDSIQVDANANNSITTVTSYTSI